MRQCRTPVSYTHLAEALKAPFEGHPTRKGVGSSAAQQLREACSAFERQCAGLPEDMREAVEESALAVRACQESEAFARGLRAGARLMLQILKDGEA